MTLFANTDLILTDQVAQALLSSRDNKCNFSIAADFHVHNDVITHHMILIQPSQRTILVQNNHHRNKKKAHS